MKSLCLITLMCMVSPAAVHAYSLEGGLGYSTLDLSNPDNTTARSTGISYNLGVYVGLFGNQNYDFGLKASSYFAKLDNDVNTNFLSEETKHFNVGAGFELNVYDFFVGYQYKYNRIRIDLAGNLNNNSSFSDLMSQFELGYAFKMQNMSIRLVYQRTQGTLSMIDSGLSNDTDVVSNAFMVILRFELGSSRDNNYRYGSGGSNYQSVDRSSENEAYIPNYRSYRYAPRPSTNIK